MTPPSELRDRIRAWVSSVLANRAVIEPLDGTEVFTGRVKGLPSIGTTGRTKMEADANLHSQLEEYAERMIAAGKPLPTWEADAPTPGPEITAIVRLSVLRRTLKERAGAWGAARLCLPRGAEERCLVDLDAVVTRHAMQMQGTVPPRKPSQT